VKRSVERDNALRLLDVSTQSLSLNAER
jgi:hypothetical protein